MKIVTAIEMRDTDRLTSERFGVPSLTLMENAGSAVAEFALSAYPSATTFGVICGKGNNGGDGFVAARKLHEAGKEVLLVLLGNPEELHGDAASNYKRLPTNSAALPFAIFKGWEDPKTAQALSRGDVLIDAILGSGFRPPVSGIYAQAIAKINAATAPVIAVDIPSGADADVMGEQAGAVTRAN